jgi:electron transfer flavoprotein beta subunit
MKILVAVKQVAALDEDFEIRADKKDVDEDFLLFDLNEWDDFSLEEAMRIKEESPDTEIEVVVVSIGPDRVDESLRKCLAKGADRAIRVWDDAVEGSDTVAIGKMLAAVVKKEAPDMVFAGVQSSDQSYASTGIAMAAYLGLPHAAVVADLKYSPGANKATIRR